MGVYTDFEAKLKHSIFYQYVCQHCGENSGTLMVELVGTARKRKNGVNAKLSDEERINLDERAKQNLKTNLDKLRTDTDAGVFGTDFDGKCPCCGKYQKWSGGTFFKYVFVTPFWFALGVCFIGILPFALLASNKAWDGKATLVNALIVFGLSYAVCFVWSLIRWIYMKNKSRGARTDALPIIDWNGM